MCIIKESRTSLILSGTKTNAVKNIQEALNVSKRSARGLAQNAVYTMYKFDDCRMGNKDEWKELNSRISEQLQR